MSPKRLEYMSQESALINLDEVAALKKSKAVKEMKVKRDNIGKKPWYVDRYTVKPQD